MWGKLEKKWKNRPKKFKEWEAAGLFLFTFILYPIAIVNVNLDGFTSLKRTAIATLFTIIFLIACMRLWFIEAKINKRK